MKKFTIILIIFFAFLTFFTNRVDAQKTITCEEWKKIVGTDKCKYSNIRAAISDLKDHNSIWCSSDSKEIENDTYENRPPDYKYDTSEEKCIFDAQTEAYERQTGKSIGKPSLFVDEPDFLETFRQLLEVLPDPRGVLDRVRKQGVSQTKIEEMVTPELLARLPYITPADEQKVWDSLANFTSSAQNDIIVVKGKIKVKSPTLDDFIQVMPKEKPVSVTYLDAVITAADPEPIQLGYPWGPDAGAVISLPQGTEMELGANTRSLRLNRGEVEVKIQNNDPQNPFNVHSGSLTVVAPRTHFWVSQKSDKNQTVVGVYQGEVQVTTQDGQTASVAPTGDKPGIVVVSQKLSPIKLVLAGLVLAAIVGGVVWFIKKKISVKSYRKK